MLLLLLLSASAVLAGPAAGWAPADSPLVLESHVSPSACCVTASFLTPLTVLCRVLIGGPAEGTVVLYFRVGMGLLQAPFGVDETVPTFFIGKSRVCSRVSHKLFESELVLKRPRPRSGPLGETLDVSICWFVEPLAEQAFPEDKTSI